MMSNSAPSLWFWNFTGIAIAISSFGLSWSLIRASNYKLEAVNHKLEVNTAVERVKKVSDTLTESVERLPTTEKVLIEQELVKASEALLQTQKEILADEEDTKTGQGEI